MKLTVAPNCFVGEPLDFANWRLLLAKAAGYGVAPLEVDEFTHLVPDFDDTGMTFENIMGIWDIEPEDILIVLLAHSDEDGVIYPAHMEALANRIEELIPDLVNFSQYEHESPQQLAEELVTQRFVAGLRAALAEDVAITFHCEDVG